ncbi:NACHT domain-containing protein [Streptomyces xiangluensis]|uniref:NACHT domain-containing protein n=1 Tax=Streptomyces xiangluensis TaxID=2665720 RepID=A0ABV8YRS1_9ACTN
MVITGPPGAGKTLLALELLLGLLADSQQGQPVPVRAPLASWNTTTPFEEWLAERVHDQLRAHGASFASARALVAQRRVLPVLDGLDETDPDATTSTRSRAARILEALNTYQDTTGSAPLILTCRTAEYAQLGHLDLQIRRAAHIALEAVSADQASDYLTARGANLTRWRPVLDALRRPDRSPHHPLASSLSTPWRLNLAATAYEERDPRTHAYLRNPVDLLTFHTSERIRDHLLSLYIASATRQHPSHPDSYRPDQVHRWLTILATTPSADALPRTELVLHQLWPLAGPRLVRVIDAVFTILLALALSSLFLAQVSIGFSPRELFGAGALVVVAASAILRAASAQVSQPVVTQLHRLRSRGHRRQLALSAPFGLVGGFTAGFMAGLTDGFRYGLTAGLTLGLLLWLTVAFTQRLGAPEEEELSLTDPRGPVREDLVVGLALGLALGFTLGFTYAVVDLLTGGLTYALTSGLPYGLTYGLALGLAGGLYWYTSAGRRYLVFLCCARVRGMLPLQLGAFLNWAYIGGLLRISGIAYQYRHRELQDWLIQHPQPRGD